MLQTEILSVPLWTDIVQAVGVGLGFPLTIYSVFALFRRNNEADVKIKSLVDIAMSQNHIIKEMQNQLDEFRIQTQEMQFQSQLMQDSNELVRSQIELQTRALINDADYKSRLLDFEMAKRKTDNRPYFAFAAGTQSGLSGEFSISLRNIGKIAVFKQIIDSQTNPIVIFRSKPANDKNVDYGQTIKIDGSLREKSERHDIPNYEFTIEFADIDGVKYQQTLYRWKDGREFVMTKPFEITEG